MIRRVLPPTIAPYHLGHVLLAPVRVVGLIIGLIIGLIYLRHLDAGLSGSGEGF